MMLLTNNRIYLVQNSPNQMQVDYLFFDMDPAKTMITGAYRDTLKSSEGVFQGTPTKVNYIGRGLDDKNQLILMTLTLPRGAQDLKNSMTLLNP